MYQEYKAKGLEVLLITFREDADLVKRTVQERGYVAPVLLDASGDVTGKSYGVWGPPAAYFIDRKGFLIGRIVGKQDWAGEGRTMVRALLEARPAR